MVYDNLKLNQRCSKDSLVVALVVVLFLHGAKTTILEKPIDDHKDTILTMFGGGEKWHVIHGRRLMGLVWDRERTVQPSFLNAWFNNETGSAWINIMVDVLSNIWLVEILLK